MAETATSRQRARPARSRRLASRLPTARRARSTGSAALPGSAGTSTPPPGGLRRPTPRPSTSSPQVATSWRRLPPSSTWAPAAATSRSPSAPARPRRTSGRDAWTGANAPVHAALVQAEPLKAQSGHAAATRSRVSARCSGSTFTSASTGMKLVSPAQRGTTCSCTWSMTPAPAIRPRFQPRL